VYNRFKYFLLDSSSNNINNVNNTTKSVQYRIRDGFTMDLSSPIVDIILTPETSRTSEQKDFYIKMGNALSTEVKNWI
jgi:hypothetical protein